MSALPAFSKYPGIAVEQPAGTALVDGTAVVGFGEAGPCANITRTFLIRNTGPDELHGVGLSFIDANDLRMRVTAP